MLHKFVNFRGRLFANEYAGRSCRPSTPTGWCHHNSQRKGQGSYSSSFPLTKALFDEFFNWLGIEVEDMTRHKSQQASDGGSNQEESGHLQRQAPSVIADNGTRRVTGCRPSGEEVAGLMHDWYNLRGDGLTHGRLNRLKKDFSPGRQAYPKKVTRAESRRRTDEHMRWVMLLGARWRWGVQGSGLARSVPPSTGMSVKNQHCKDISYWGQLSLDSVRDRTRKPELEAKSDAAPFPDKTVREESR